ncbi:hypothetical protein ACIHEJ_38260 [Streptomyces sp. NPDC052301]|uniref:hypothetical protein n=1 Tax=Streptomyces sp. NPDC052301 TaxID=3365687 RepID=UPI0037CE6024
MEDRTQQEQASAVVHRRVRDSFDRHRPMPHPGARLAHVGPGRVHPGPTRWRDYVHAGATGAVAGGAGGERKLIAGGRQTSIHVSRSVR